MIVTVAQVVVDMTEKLKIGDKQVFLKETLSKELIKVKQFGKDHWSLLAHVEYRVQNHRGFLELKHLRIKNPSLPKPYLSSAESWKPEYGSRLYGYWNQDGTTNPELLLLDHDDYDCLDDLEKAGFVKSFGTGINPAFKLTKKGIKVCGLLTQHKQDGKNYSGFVLGDVEHN